MNHTEATQYIKATLVAFGPGDAMGMTLDTWTKLHEAMSVLIEQPAQQEPVAFLANGTRFKISYDSRQSGGQIHGIPPELGGRWVAFVAADDDCHLKLTSPQPAQRKPLKERELMKCITQAKCFDTVKMTYESGPYEIDRPTLKAFEFARAIEAAHGIKDQP